MSGEPVFIPSAPNTNLGTSGLSSDPSSTTLWDRVTVWASENKAIAYTIAGVVVVASGAGIVYYNSNSKQNTPETDKKRSSKKEKRKAKLGKDRQQGQSESSPTNQRERYPLAAL